LAKKDRKLKESMMATSIIKSVMKAIYNLSDEDNYNLYDSDDIAEYLGLELEVVERTLATLEEGRFISECMNLHDDGVL